MNAAVTLADGIQGAAALLFPFRPAVGPQVKSGRKSGHNFKTKTKFLLCLPVTNLSSETARATMDSSFLGRDGRMKETTYLGRKVILSVADGRSVGLGE